MWIVLFIWTLCATSNWVSRVFNLRHDYLLYASQIVIFMNSHIHMTFICPSRDHRNQCRRTNYHVCNIAYSHVWHDWFMCATWLIHMTSPQHSHVRHDHFMCATWLICMTSLQDHRNQSRQTYGRVCDMTHSHMGHDSFVCLTWPFHVWCVFYSHVAHDSF